jgi:hypothetical protein
MRMIGVEKIFQTKDFDHLTARFLLQKHDNLLFCCLEQFLKKCLVDCPIDNYGSAAGLYKMAKNHWLFSCCRADGTFVKTYFNIGGDE